MARAFLEAASRSAERAFLKHLPGVGAKGYADADLVRALTDHIGRRARTTRRHRLDAPVLSLLFEVAAADLATFALVPLILALAAAAAT